MNMLPLEFANTTVSSPCDITNLNESNEEQPNVDFIKQEIPEAIDLSFELFEAEVRTVKTDEVVTEEEFKSEYLNTFDRETELSTESGATGCLEENINLDKDYSGQILLRRQLKKDIQTTTLETNASNNSLSQALPAKKLITCKNNNGSAGTSDMLKNNKKKKTNKKIINDSDLLRKREKAADRKRKQRAKIRQNLEAYERSKEREKERSRKRREEKKIKCIADLSERLKRKQRKQWREQYHRNAVKRKNLKKTDVFLKCNTPPDSETENHLQQPSTKEDGRIPRRKKRIQQSRESMRKQIEDLQKEVLRQKSNSNRWKLSYYGLKQSIKECLKEPPSPIKMAKMTTKKGKKEVKKNLITGEIMPTDVTSPTTLLTTARVSSSLNPRTLCRRKVRKPIIQS